MDSVFKEKYLKYKAKYLELKNQKGGELSDETKLNLQIDMCMSYVTEIIGAMDNTIAAIKENAAQIKKNYDSNVYDGFEKTLVGLILQNGNIPHLRVFNMDAKNDMHRGKLYKDLFYFHHMDQGKYFVEKETRAGGYRESTILNIQTLQYFQNTLVSLEANQGVHWIYIDENSQIHNPYNYNMQINHSHQFCQTHSLLMALVPQTRSECLDLYDQKKNEEENSFLTRKCSYLRLLSLLKIILPFVIRRSFSLNQSTKKKKLVVNIDNSLHEEIIKEIKDINTISGKSQNAIETNSFVNQFLEDFLKMPQNHGQAQSYEDIANYVTLNILAVLNTAHAHEIVPDFE